MGSYVLRRLLWAVVVLWAIVTVTFGATFLSPIDPAKAYAGLRATEAQVKAVRERFGLDDPLYVQYVRYLGRMARGDLGMSYQFGLPVRDAIFARLPATAILALAAIAVQLALGIPLGLAAALRRRQLLDRIVLVFSLLGVVTPSFVVGFLFLYFFAFKLGWFPLGGREGAASLILPALTLGIAGAAWYARMLRSTVLNILSEDYVRTARAKGLRERQVVGAHVMRNALNPIVTMVALDLGVFLGGVLVIERVFAWPGIGLQAWQAIEFNDVPMILGTVTVAAAFVTLLNLAADLLNAVLDVRIRHA
jgi:peptide/nickel transport system permease protein